jgi:hypothetical protein
MWSEAFGSAIDAVVGSSIRRETKADTEPARLPHQFHSTSFTLDISSAFRGGVRGATSPPRH